MDYVLTHNTLRNEVLVVEGKITKEMTCKKISSSCREVQVIDDKIMVNVWRKSRGNQLWFK